MPRRKIKREINRPIGVASAVMQTALVLCDEERAEPQDKALDLAVSLRSYPPLWSQVTGRMKSQVQVAKISFLRRLAGLSLRYRVRSSAIQEKLIEKPLLLCAERSQII